MFTFSSFQFMPIYPKPGHLKSQFFLLFNTAWIFLSYPLSPLPLTRDTRVVILQRNVSQLVQIWIFNISNRDSFIQLIHVGYKSQPKWICVTFSFQYTLLIIFMIYDICVSILMSTPLNVALGLLSLQFFKCMPLMRVQYPKCAYGSYCSLNPI